MSSMLDQRPVVAFTVGDIAGVGPELVAIALSRPEVHSLCRPLVIGPLRVIAERSRELRLSLNFRRVEHPGNLIGPGFVGVLEPDGVAVAGTPKLGQVDPSAGRIAGLCLTEAFSLAAGGRVQGVVAAPINKEAFRLGGFDYVDEIAFLMELTGSSEPRLFGILEHVWTTCVTLHTAFRDIPQAITKERVFGVIKSMHDALAKVGAGRAAIAVAALNPHNGEGGLLGREELDEIGPAVHDARDVGIDVSGPYPADTVFPRAIASKIRGVVCMYHDQANIARKLHGYQDSATAFIGLPVPYATTAHGTAFDIVGTGKADPSSLVAALRFVLGQCNAEKGDAQRAPREGSAL